MAMIREIYERLGLQGFEEAKPGFRSYLEQMEDYKKNKHEIGSELQERIEREWAFAFKEWGYE